MNVALMLLDKAPWRKTVGRKRMLCRVCESANKFRQSDASLVDVHPGWARIWHCFDDDRGMMNNIADQISQ